MERLASLIALILHSRRESSDLLARLERVEPLNVAAEMRWKLMPPRVYADGRVVIAGALEPAYRISGDAFDYATDGPVVHLSVFDAMGHDTAAGLSAALAVGACRNTRRQGGGLVACGEAVEAELIEQYDQRRYVTGILAALDTRTGVLSWVNRGHHPPVIIRDGRWVAHPQCPPAHPMGTGLGLESRVCREQLQPGDRVVLYTDGIVEAGGAGGPRFGVERFTGLLIRHHADGLSVPETLRRVVHAVLEHHGDRLQDDATVLFCQWLGPGPSPTGEGPTWAGCPRPAAPPRPGGTGAPRDRAACARSPWRPGVRPHRLRGGRTTRPCRAGPAARRPPCRPASGGGCRPRAGRRRGRPTARGAGSAPPPGPAIPRVSPEGVWRRPGIRRTPSRPG